MQGFIKQNINKRKATAKTSTTQNNRIHMHQEEESMHITINPLSGPSMNLHIIQAFIDLYHQLSS
uniref:Uncharacterized protein n=1 Tax=Arundo donax TaxID=35708 RepID=A0A0A9EKZ1_ARUDO